MMNMLQQMMQQQQTQPLTKEEELIIHQEPIAMAMRTLMKILEYEKRTLPTEIFNPMVESLQANLNEALNNVKIPNIPPMSDIVSINGEPAHVVSQG